MENRWNGNVRELEKAVENACILTLDGTRPSLIQQLPGMHLLPFLSVWTRSSEAPGRVIKLLARSMEVGDLPTFDLRQLMDDLDEHLGPDHRGSWRVSKRVLTLKRENERTDGATVPIAATPMQEDVLDLPYKELMRHYTRRLMSKNTSNRAAARAAGVTNPTIANWRRKFCGDQ